jgi:ferredoxin-NADP reductase
VIVRVSSNELATPTTRRLRLAVDGHAFPYHAGQAASLRAAGGASTPYSIASAPAETRRTGHVEFLIKTDGSNRFGAVVDGLRPGTPVDMSEAAGSFTLNGVANGAPLLFIAGGTGIAPVRSMIREAVETSRRGALSLVYSNRLPEEFAYLGEFRQMAADRQLTLRLTLTGDAEDWTHARGRAGVSHLSELVAPATTAFICGPTAMVTELPATLRALGVDRIVTERW